MSPLEAVVRLRELCDETRSVVRTLDVRAILDLVDQRAEPALIIGEAEARILLALLDHQPIPAASLDLLETITGRLQTIGTATGTHRAVEPNQTPNGRPGTPAALGR